MKIQTALLLAVLLCGSAFGKTETPVTLDTVIAKSVRDWAQTFVGDYPGKPKGGWPQIEAFYKQLAGADEALTNREVLAGFASSDAKLSAFTLTFIRREKRGQVLTTLLDTEAARLTKAGDGKAATVRRARELFARQLDESGTLPAAQTAVADALKALEVKK